MRVYTLGNYFLIGDLSDFKSEVKFKIVSAGVYRFFSDDIGNIEFLFSDITDENGAAYSSQSVFETWAYLNTATNESGLTNEELRSAELSINIPADNLLLSGNGALRTVSPNILFDGKTLGADDTNFIWQNTGSGSFTWANNMLLMAVTSGQYCIRSSKRRVSYVAGYPLEIEHTFDNMNIEANLTKYVGYYDTSATASHTANRDGFALVMDGLTYRLISWNEGTETSNTPLIEWSGYNDIQSLNFDNFTAGMFTFLWLGGAYLAYWLATPTGWKLAHLVEWVGTIKGTICKTPNHSLKYEIRSATGAGDFRAICSQASVGGDINSAGQEIICKNAALIQCNTIGTIYALAGFKKNATYRDICILIHEIGCTGGASSDTGTLMLIRNPTLSAALTYAPFEKFDRATGTTQTVTAGTGDIIAIIPAGSTGGTSSNISSNYRAWLTQGIADTFDQYILCYESASTNQDVRAYATLKQF